jgi:hypothetical protein
VGLIFDAIREQLEEIIEEGQIRRGHNKHKFKEGQKLGRVWSLGLSWVYSQDHQEAGV